MYPYKVSLFLNLENCTAIIASNWLQLVLLFMVLILIFLIYIYIKLTYILIPIIYKLCNKYGSKYILYISVTSHIMFIIIGI